MSEWSKSAAPQFKQKRKNEQRARDIVEAEAANIFISTAQKLQQETKDFNVDSGNAEILRFQAPHGVTACVVSRTDSQKSLTIGHDVLSHEIKFDGAGGLIFTRHLLIKADLETSNAYLADKKEGAPVNVDGIIAEALNKLLDV